MSINDRREIPVVFSCEGSELVGIIHAAAAATTGLLLVSGGNQYRVGSHRLFVDLARSLARAGISVMRFDHRGVGDTEGPYPGFDSLALDIRAAIIEFKAQCPSVQYLVLGGLCDGASAILIALNQIPDINQIVMINPWVHTNELEARTRLVSYYSSRLKNKNFWSKLLRGKMNLRESFSTLFRYLKVSTRSNNDNAGELESTTGFIERMCDGVRGFNGSVLIVLSGQDLVAQQFQQLATSHKDWKEILERPGIDIVKLRDADHTFSVRNERRNIEQLLKDRLNNR